VDAGNETALSLVENADAGSVRQGNCFAIRLPVDPDRLVQDPTGGQATRGLVRECGYVPNIANRKMAFFEGYTRATGPHV
jgi:hypothetical protein